ncbi:UbiH/UbiF family hydroxylase [Antarcticirhabdus aurantiaca]|uniref:UbiH/UbiF family hydroxylase n=1 Tax=Antarcticirhabdus aurantiaca TaxID=2606717 RepID=A0ACD4NVR3_9HYPH|nr:UbiH/UbiF family hydroxylase [Antarcticirhabdus aurantiaca]WAJ30929.1 UbiH/UbiF family hydroxylase [Jeongeuplla avenae]
MASRRCEVAVVGGGLAGAAAAIAFAAEGFDTLLAAPAPPETDRRSTALIGRSVAFLSAIGVFEAARPHAEALRSMRLIDDTGRLLKAPTVEFRASEIGVSAFGYNILNTDLAAALAGRAAALSSHLTTVEARVEEIRFEDDHAVLDLGEAGTWRAQLVVGADGRRSIAREKAGIAAREWRYPQTALVFNFEHARAHDGVSNEFHTRSGPFTQVPLPGSRSSLVWVEAPDRADLYADLKPERLGAVVEQKLHSILGAVTVEEPIQRFPLSGLSAAAMSGPRLALVGEAAHAFPPIGAQGLNLGLRDVEALVSAVRNGRDDPGSASVLRRYAQGRVGDVSSRSSGVDLLNRSLLADFLPVQAARSVGLGALRNVGFLRHFAMREGISPGAGFTGIPRSVREGIDG